MLGLASAQLIQLRGMQVLCKAKCSHVFPFTCCLAKLSPSLIFYCGTNLEPQTCLFTLKHNPQGYEVVFYGDSITERLRGTSMGG